MFKHILCTKLHCIILKGKAVNSKGICVQFLCCPGAIISSHEDSAGWRCPTGVHTPKKDIKIHYIYNIRYSFQQPTWDALGWRSFSTHLVQRSSSARMWNHTNHHTRLTPPLNGPTRAPTQAGQAASNGDLWMVQKPPQGSDQLLCNQH